MTGAPELTPLEVVVRDQGGAYNTQGRGHRASCTHSAQAAVERLAAKVYVDTPARVDLLSQQTPGVSRWRITPGSH